MRYLIISESKVISKTDFALVSYGTVDDAQCDDFAGNG